MMPLLLARSLAHLGFFFWLVCVLAIIALHLLPTRLHPLRDYVSRYALTSHGKLYSLQAICSGLAAVCLLILLVVRGLVIPRWGLAGLGLYAFSRLLIPTFPMDKPGQTTRTGKLHLLLATTTFLGIVGATMGLTHSLVKQAPWSEFASLLRTARFVTVISSLAFLRSFFSRWLDRGIGAIERGIYLGCLVWLGAIFSALLF